jgi:hypothetical protein
VEPLVTGDLAHTHAPGNVGIRGEASCPACRAAGVTLTDEQRALVDELLGTITTASMGDIRDHLIEAILRAAEQERARIATRLDTTATAYEQNAAAAIARAADGHGTGDAIRLDLADATTWTERATTLRRVTL